MTFATGRPYLSDWASQLAGGVPFAEKACSTLAKVIRWPWPLLTQQRSERPCVWVGSSQRCAAEPDLVGRLHRRHLGSSVGNGYFPSGRNAPLPNVRLSASSH